jgi:hypothetical protein
VSAGKGPHLHKRPLNFDVAAAFVTEHHRHHDAPRGHKFSIGVLTDDGALVGVAITGRPVARAFDNGLTLEVTRVATLGTPNACSALYAAAWQTAKAQGYRRIITYTQDGESGASLRAVGWRKVARRKARPGWDVPSRPRASHGTDNIDRDLWLNATADAPPLPDLRYETRDETKASGKHRKCPGCGAVLPIAATGRPARYCGSACRQRAYRQRKSSERAA